MSLRAHLPDPSRMPGAWGVLGALGVAVLLHSLSALFGCALDDWFEAGEGHMDLRGTFFLHSLAWLSGSELIDRAVARLPGGVRLPAGWRALEAVAFTPLLWLLWDLFPGPLRSTNSPGLWSPEADSLYQSWSLLVFPPIHALCMARRLHTGLVQTRVILGLCRVPLAFGVPLLGHIAVGGPVTGALAVAVVGFGWVFELGVLVGSETGPYTLRPFPAVPLRTIGVVGLFLSLFVCSDAGWRLPGLCTLLPLRDTAAATGAPLARLLSELAAWAAGRGDRPTPPRAWVSPLFWFEDGAWRDAGAFDELREGSAYLERHLRGRADADVIGCADGVLVRGRYDGD